MGSSTPDALPWPEYADPGAVPTDMHELAVAVQAALNKKGPLTPVSTAVTPSSGFVQGAPGMSLQQVGKIVVCRGIVHRSANLAVADNTLYQFGVIPAGLRPTTDVFMAGAWTVFDTARNGEQRMTTQVVARAGGEFQVVSNVNGTWQSISTQFVSIGGLSWLIP